MARNKVPINFEERRAWIKFQLELKGLSLADIAREGGATRQTVRKSLEIKYPKWDRMIAAKIGLDVAELYPERYAA